MLAWDMLKTTGVFYRRANKSKWRRRILRPFFFLPKIFWLRIPVL